MTAELTNNMYMGIYRYVHYHINLHSFPSTYTYYYQAIISSQQGHVIWISPISTGKEEVVALMKETVDELMGK